jgi:arylsulfatase A-like enzyme
MSELHSYPGFSGHVERTREESTPSWNRAAVAAPGSPNVIVIYMDDMGYSDIGCYGSEISTPHIDALAARGQRFNHYTTHPICSPARAALLTGRNAHSVGTGWLASNNPGYPGYTGEIPLEAPTLAETFRAAGYATGMVGKWHNSSKNNLPNAQWPTQRGFDYFYGFLGGETSYFFPARIMINNAVAPIDQYPPDYYATDDWTDHALRYMCDVRNRNAATPFLLYVSYNAMHGPLQAKETDLRKYRGRYDRGWDVLRAERLERQKTLGLVPPETQLAPSDPSVPAWNSLGADVRAHYARYMETYAAMLDCVDQNVGRIVAQLADMGELDNTIIAFSTDNGGTGSAGPTGQIYFNRVFSGLPFRTLQQDMQKTDLIGSGRTMALYPRGWGQAGNTPFSTYKTRTGGGGRRVSFVISWPAKLSSQGSIQTEFAHVTDVMPTLMNLAGVAPIASSHGKAALPMHGTSLAPLLLHGDGRVARHEQYYECWANRAFWRDGWVAVSLQKLGEPIDFDNWTLHEQASDFSESVDLAAQHPERLKELAKAFDDAAWANLVYPLDNRTAIKRFNEIPPHLRPPATSTRRFLSGGQTIPPPVVVPLIADRNFRIVTRVTHAMNDEGILFAIGCVTAGMVLSVEDGRLNLFYNGYGEERRISAAFSVSGDFDVTVACEARGMRSCRGQLRIGDTALTEWTDLGPTLMSGMHEGLDIGMDRRAPVDWELWERRGGFAYTGSIRDLTIDSMDFAPDSEYGKS